MLFDDLKVASFTAKELDDMQSAVIGDTQNYMREVFYTAIAYTLGNQYDVKSPTVIADILSSIDTAVQELIVNYDTTGLVIKQYVKDNLGFDFTFDSTEIEEAQSWEEQNEDSKND